MKKDTNKIICCLCGEEIQDYGNNPYPLAGEKCCTACDLNYVMPVRAFMSKLDEKYESAITPYERYQKLLSKNGIKF